MSTIRGCCKSNLYTTRSYDLAGNTAWIADYFQGVKQTPIATIANCAYITQFALATNTYSNGSSGVGATITSNSNVSLFVDGFNPTTGQSIIVNNEANQSHDGIYTVMDPGSGSTPFVLMRRTDFDQPFEIKPPIIVTVTSGPHNGFYILSTGAVTTVGTDPIAFQSYTASSGKIVITQAVDSSRVYVGGQRMTNSSAHSWSVTAFDIDTGQFLWDYDLGADCQKILVDQAGNVVCMVDLGSANNVDNSTLLTQHFIQLQPDGTFIADISFAQVHSPSQGATHTVRTVDFCINETGDYHVLGYCVFPGGNFSTTDIYEWLTPFTSTPTLREFPLHFAPLSISRIGGRDYLCGSRTRVVQPEIAIAVAQGKSQQASPASSSDFDLITPPNFYDATLFPLSSSTIVALGTNQSTAAPLFIGNDYTTITGITSAGIRLPSGAAVGDMVGINRGSYPSSIGALNYFIYPPTGGSMNFDSTIVKFQPQTGSVWVCTGNDNWVGSLSSQENQFLDSMAQANIAVDSNGFFLKVLGGFPTKYASATSVAQRLYKLNSTGVPLWVKGTLAFNTPTSVAVDAANTIYTIGPYDSGFVTTFTVAARDTNGNWLWGHFHSGAGPYWQTIQPDPDGLHIIVSGYDNVDGGPNGYVANFGSFVADPDSVISFGRTATGARSGIGINYGVNVPGSTVQAGTILIATLADNSNVNAGAGLSISGGSAWTKLTGGVTGYASSAVWMKVCGASEPNNFTVSYSGTASTDSACCTIQEVFKANATNPDDVQFTTNSGTPAAATSSAVTDCSVLCVADLSGLSTAFDGAPSGYFMRGRNQTGTATNLTTVMATKSMVGSGTISPGAWTDPETSRSSLWQILLKS